MEQRMHIEQLAPDGVKAVYGLEHYIRSKVDPHLVHLIKLRASMLNNCAFCVDMHTTEAVNDDWDVRKVTAVAAWRESPFFSDRERVVLDLTDAATRLDEHGVPDDVWDAAAKELGEAGLADVLLAVATINVWNRIAVPTRATPPPLA